ncbi:SAG-related sequence SRS47A [Toxoplasma gondii ARI]|uniref:SAG-related sequence SRS47A n=2 Tax=Toxoplasma gondii TaxID=5811 RepID=A0A139XVH6_TOXGO|nr:SAG-related sequence SRS47A [Toxoplasma gondii ARI]
MYPPVLSEECKNGQTLVEVVPPQHSEPKKVTFRCAENWTLSPANFEKVYSAETCNQTASLASLDLGAKLVEGKSSEEAKNVPAYALQITKFPTGSEHVMLCYKCTQTSDEKEMISDSSKQECKIIVSVAPKPQHEDKEEGNEEPDTDSEENGRPSTSGATDHPNHSFVIAGALLLSSVLALNQTG